MSKSLTAMLKSSVTTRTRLERADSFLHLFTHCKWDPVYCKLTLTPLANPDFRSHNIMFKHMYREHDIGSDSGGDSEDDDDDNDDDGIVIIDSPSPPKSKPGPAVSVHFVEKILAL